MRLLTNRLRRDEPRGVSEGSPPPPPMAAPHACEFSRIRRMRRRNPATHRLRIAETFWHGCAKGLRDEKWLPHSNSWSDFGICQSMHAPHWIRTLFHPNGCFGSGKLPCFVRHRTAWGAVSRAGRSPATGIASLAPPEPMLKARFQKF